MRARLDDVEAGAVAVRREQAQRLALGMLGLADLLGQADRRQRAMDAEPLVLGHRWPLGRFAEPPGRGDRVGQVLSGRIVERHPHGGIVGVIADSPLGHGLPGDRLDQGGIGDYLEPVRRPRRRGFPLLLAPAPLVLVRQQRPVPAADRVDLADETQLRVGQLQLRLLPLLVGVERGVQLPAGVDPIVGDEDLLDLLQVEKPVAVSQGMEGHNAKGRISSKRGD